MYLDILKYNLHITTRRVYLLLKIINQSFFSYRVIYFEVDFLPTHNFVRSQNIGSFFEHKKLKEDWRKTYKIH